MNRIKKNASEIVFVLLIISLILIIASSIPTLLLADASCGSGKCTCTCKGGWCTCFADEGECVCDCDGSKSECKKPENPEPQL